MKSISTFADRKRASIICCALAALVLCPQSHGIAAGALAVGLPPDVARSGFTYGFTFDKPDEQAAQQQALEECRTTKDAAQDEKLRSLCAVITTFSNKCVAVAMDPRNGTPGVGWSVAQDRSVAEAQALAQCRQTDGAELQAACVVDHSGCDGAK
jgi:hypothetical protein